MSTLQCTNIQDTSGGNSLTTAQNYSGTAKAWVNFNGTTSPGTIRASFNVSSVTKNGTGDYTVNFSSALSDANYVTVGSCNRPSGGNGDGILSLYAVNNSGALVDPTTSAARISTSLFSNSDVDMTFICVAFFR